MFQSTWKLEQVQRQTWHAGNSLGYLGRDHAMKVSALKKYTSKVEQGETSQAKGHEPSPTNLVKHVVWIRVVQIIRFTHAIVCLYFKSQAISGRWTNLN